MYIDLVVKSPTREGKDIDIYGYVRMYRRTTPYDLCPLSFFPLRLSLCVRVASIREMDADAGACMCNKYFRSTDMTQDTLSLVRQTDR